MNKIKQTIFFVLLLLLYACNGVDCDQLPKQFTSYEEAIQKIKTANFKVDETINTSKSSWIRSASFFSCNGISGFFIIGTDKKEYIYLDIPYDIWQGFKNAESFGSYYNHNIKHKYNFKLKQ